MNAHKKMETIGVLRQDNCRGIESRIDTLIRRLQRLNKKVEWAKTAEPDEPVNIGMFELNEVYNQLQLIASDVVELEKQNTMLDLLKEIDE